MFLYKMRDELNTSPAYQRMPDIWSTEKKQFFIDSIINGFDVPKLYFHDLRFSDGTRSGGLQYAIIDGKQRLEAIWEFIDGEFALDSDFRYLLDKSVDLSELDYQTLVAKHPRISGLFDSTRLDVMVVETDNLDLIDDLFSRLNQAEPLNAAEKRNAMPPPIPKVIRELSQHPFFIEKVPFPNARYRHFDIVAKYLYSTDQNQVVSTQKSWMDKWVKGYSDVDAKNVPTRLKKLIKATETYLDMMCLVFQDKDADLLSRVGMVVVYGQLFRVMSLAKDPSIPSRKMLLNFESRRIQNRVFAAENLEKADAGLLEFDQMGYSVNSAFAIRGRLNILAKYLSEEEGLPYYGESS